MCGNCGTYRGREVVDVLAQVTRKQERAKAKAKELGQEAKPEKEALDAKELSETASKKK